MQGEPTSRSARVMRYAFWTVGLAVVVLIAGSWFASDWVLQLQRTVFGEPPIRENTATADGTAIDLPDGGRHDDDLSPGYETPLVDGLGQLVEQQHELLGDAADDVTSQLQATLAEADDIFAKTKASNREAIRQANRQPRAGRGNSSNIVLVVCQLEDKGTSGLAATTPQRAALAQTGITVARILLPPGGRDAAINALLSGRQPSTSGSMNLSQTLWQAGYSTALIGDCSAADVREDDTEGLDEWFGFRDASEVSARFPVNVWANGRQLGIAANQDDQQQVDFLQLVRAESESYLRRHRNGRPFALVINLPPRAIETSTALVDAVDAAIRANQLVQQTLLLVLDLPAEDAMSATAGEAAGTLFARWPNRLPNNVKIAEPAAIVDVLPTIAEAVSAWRKPAQLDGSSRLSSWRTAAQRES